MAERVLLRVDGMTCGGCARAVEKAILAVTGGVTVRIDLSRKEVSVESDQPVAMVTVHRAIEAAGFDILQD